jgi:hypothetical protein
MSLKYPPSTNGLQKTLAAQLDQGITASLTLNNATNIPNKPGVCVIDRIDTDGNLKNTSVREYVLYTGTSGSTLTGLTRNIDNSSSDQDHAVGAVVEFVPDVTWAQSIMDALDGTSTDAVLNTPVITTPKITTSINDANGNEVIKTPATTLAVNEVTVTNAATGNAPSIAATGGDTNIDVQLKGKGSGTVKKPVSTVIQVVAPTTALATGDGKFYFTIPPELNGMVLSAVHARVITAGTTGTTDIQLHNVTDAVDILSTKLTIDSTETGSDTAATPAVINASNDDMATNDLIRIDVDAISTTPPQGLILRLSFNF